jgi:hypothetical protein
MTETRWCGLLMVWFAVTSLGFLGSSLQVAYQSAHGVFIPITDTLLGPPSLVSALVGGFMVLMTLLLWALRLLILGK